MLFLTSNQQRQSTEGSNDQSVSELEFNVPFQHKHGYIRDE